MKDKGVCPIFRLFLRLLLKWNFYDNLFFSLNESQFYILPFSHTEYHFFTIYLSNIFLTFYFSNSVFNIFFTIFLSFSYLSIYLSFSLSLSYLLSLSHSLSFYLFHIYLSFSLSISYSLSFFLFFHVYLSISFIFFLSICLSF